MNLIEVAWIPVILENNHSKSLSLHALYLNAEDIRDLVLSPPHRIAIMRLLLCITQAALDGPVDEGEWRSCKDKIIPESLKYLSTRQSLFHLYGDKPFLQIRDLEESRNATLDKLDFGLAAGHTPTLFDHDATEQGRTHRPGWIALMLTTFQCFSPGGTIGVTRWAGKKTNGRYAEHAPGLEGAAMHTLLRGKRLLDTIHLNLLTKEQVSTLPGGKWGKPVWDIPPRSPSEKDSNENTRSYLGRLVPLSRAVLCCSEGTRMTLANGLSYPKLPAGRDPMATVVHNEKRKEHHYLRVHTSRHPWRELGALLSLKRMGVAGAALALDHLMDGGEGEIDVWVGGIAADQAKILDVAEWNFMLPLNLLFETQMTRYQRGVQLALRGESSLTFAVKEYGLAMKMEDTSLQGFREKAKTTYWTALDNNYRVLVEVACAIDKEMESWKNLLRTILFRAYREACPHESPRQIQAFSVGRKRLGIRDEQ